MYSSNWREQPQLLKEDLSLRPRLLSVCKGSGNSKKLAFTVKEFSEEGKKARVNAFIHDPMSLETFQFTRNEWSGMVSSPVVFVADPRSPITEMVLFLKSGQIWCQPLRGGDAVQVTSFAVDVQEFRIFQQASLRCFLLLSMSVYADKSPAETALFDATEGSGKSVMIFDKLMVRHWDRWEPYKKRNHLFLCPLDITSDMLLTSNPAKAVDIMRGMHTDCPAIPFGGQEDFDVSPDGRLVVFSARKVEEDGSQPQDMAWTTQGNIRLVDVTDGVIGELRNISPPEIKGFCSHPSFSMLTGGYESDKNEIMIHDIEKSQSLHRTRSIDLSFESSLWGLNHIYATAQFRGATRVFKIKIFPDEADDVFVMRGDANRVNLILNEDSAIEDKLYFVESTLVSAPELRFAQLRLHSGSLFEKFSPLPIETLLGEQPVQMGENFETRDLLDVFGPCPEYQNGDKIMPTVTQHYITAGGGDTVHLWYLPPTFLPPNERHGMDLSSKSLEIPHRSVPLVLIIHGGPQGAFLNSWSTRWNLSFFSSLGYGVVAVNFHGSTGFGKTFVDSIRGDWGGKPYQDCNAAVDYVLAKYPYLDPERMGALGASYGGYMINWINGHTERFKVLVNHDGIFSLKGLYYSTEEIWFPEWEFGTPFESTEQYDKWSPDNFIKDWKTPTLVIHGSADFRVCETEGISTFSALQRLGIPSKLVVFPTENHWVLNARNSLTWHQEVSEWLKKWLE